jgi:2-polyprenyl-3-methyl-5-hydroxy-6-metoxy-1,4-benzoquinol methylase
MTTKADYHAKPDAYFEGARADFVARLPDNPEASILEIGCAFGLTGELALARGKCGRYVGVDISEHAAAAASGRLSDVLVGNVETMDLPFAPASLDALIMSEVLEHLIDPWKVLARLRPLLRPGALVMASSPNIAQTRLVLSLLKGRWDLEDRGPMDRTHMRWFTPATYREMFEQAGFRVTESYPLLKPSAKARLANRLAGGRIEHLFWRQICVVAEPR